MAEKTEPKIYHIHLDTQTPSEKLHHRIQKELGFFPHHFTGHPDGYVHFEPTAHTSIKLHTKNEFEAMWEQCAALVEKEPDVIGYMEGEYIPSDVAIPFTPTGTFFKPPFQIVRRRLDSKRGEKFRETEFHLLMDWDTSDKRVINGLLDAGLYGAILQKKDWRGIVLTIQGYQRDIHPLIVRITEYLTQVGGAARCTIKEEVALKNRLFNMSVEDLPEIIDTITYW